MFKKQKIIRYYRKIISSFWSSKRLPTFIALEASPNCILKCQHCDIWKSPHTKPLSLSDAKKIIDKLAEWLNSFTLSLYGGEPLLNKSLPEIIKYATDKGIATHFNTNGVLLNKRLVNQIIEAGLSGITFSLDAKSAKIHNWLRGKDKTFQKTVSAIRLIKQLRKENQPKIYLSTVIIKQNLDELTKLVCFTEDEELDGISFQSLMPNFSSKKGLGGSVKKILWPETKKVKKTIEKLIREAKTNPLIQSTQKELELAIKYYESPSSLSMISCQAGNNNFIIDNHGNVKLCFQYPPIGNIFKTSPLEIWRGKKAQDQRQVIQKCQDPCKILRCNL